MNKNYNDLQIDLLTQEIKSVKDQICVLETKLHSLREAHAWHVLVKAGRISNKSGLEEIETIKRKDRLKQERENWSKGVIGVPRKYKGSNKRDNKKAGPTNELEKWLGKRGGVK